MCAGVSVTEGDEGSDSFECHLFSDCAYMLPQSDNVVYSKLFPMSNYWRCIFFAKSFTIILARNDDSFDSFFFVDKCDATTTSDVISNPTNNCLLYPTLLCNGVRNCASCQDEVSTNCLAVKPCTGGNWSQVFCDFPVLDSFKLHDFFRVESVWLWIDTMRSHFGSMQRSFRLSQRLGRTIHALCRIKNP